MYVCLCNPTTDSQIEAASKTAASIKELKNKLSICKGCGTCAKTVRDIYHGATSNSSTQPLTSGCLYRH